MPNNVVTRETEAQELPQILALYPSVFPDEELRPVVSRLLEGEAEVLSLAAFEGDAPIAHVLFTLFNGERHRGAGALLGPLGVSPGHQGQGLGSALVTNALERLDAIGVRQVFVLGDPAYYGRFGFQPERQVSTPYPLPEQWTDAWQSMLLSGRMPFASGRCPLPAPWMDPALWRP